MTKKRKTPIQDPVVPPQNRHICGTICICQMTAILSTVSIVYLSVAIYFPSMRAFSSGIIEEPVMCSTSKVVTVDKCNWGSCGEWCLSKTSGSCSQIYVNLRKNGSSLQFENCTNWFNKTCYGIDQENVRRYRCKQNECKELTGIFNCSSGSCINITNVFRCIFQDVDDPLNCTGPRGRFNCMDIHGLNTCTFGICSQINEPYNCDRRCVDIPTRNKNVILISGDSVFLSRCATVSVDLRHKYLDDPATKSASGLVSYSNKGIWNDSQMTIFLASCFTVSNAPDQVHATDCVNGTILDRRLLDDSSNFTFLYGLTILNDSKTEQEQSIAPAEVDLLIANDSRLLINLEGCVNTLKDECREFMKEYGKDGGHYNARARFHCYYATFDPTLVLARFDLELTYNQFLPAIVVPSVLLVVSCFILILCQRTVEVGDDAKMRFKWRSNMANVKNKTASKSKLTQTNIVHTADTIDDKGGGGEGNQKVNL